MAEDEDGIHAMIHLNPFRLSVNGSVRTLHYIVAVSTQKAYRHRGLMRRLLAAAEKRMEADGEKLTFLMPASEQIYHPFGYRFFGWQRRGILGETGAFSESGDRMEKAAGRISAAVQQNYTEKNAKKSGGIVTWRRQKRIDKGRDFA